MSQWRHALRAARTVRSAAWPEKVLLYEVSARDGLQNESVVVPTAEKIAYLNQLTSAKFRAVEVTSFVSPIRVPQLADAAEVLKGIDRKEGVLYPVLTPNMKGLENALEAGAREAAVFTAASEAFCRRNMNATIDESLKQFEKMSVVAKRANVRMRGYLSCALGCPFTGNVEPERVADIATSLIELGCYEVSIGDTIGVGTVASVQRVFEACLRTLHVEQLAAHMHDTYGQGLSNVVASLQLGVHTVDASIAGLGGCPFAQGATGNVATEDVLYLLDGLGIEHGVDWGKVLHSSQYIANIVGTTNRSRAATALLRKHCA